MKDEQPEDIQLVSCDLNGTLVHQHTMMDMIRVYFPQVPERYEKAKAAFSKQTSGYLSMKEAFEVAGPLTKGLSLRNAIDYAQSVMRFLEGFEEFIATLYDRKKYFVINSTGYTVTTEVIKALYGPEKVHGVICNRLIFGWEGNPAASIEEDHLGELVRNYLQGAGAEKAYDEILATGDVELGIRDEEEKASLLFSLAENLGVPQKATAHVGDTMGDSGGICGVARNGGLGIAFNYNPALKNYLDIVLKEENISGRIIKAEPKSETADLSNLLRILLSPLHPSRERV
jgi:phosphoserine phosphatase